MKSFAGTDNHPSAGDDSSADALGGTLSLADTLEEDGERYRDVIRDLTEFEEKGAETETVITTEDVHDMDAKPGSAFA